MKGKRIGKDVRLWRVTPKNALDFLPEARLSSWILAGLLARFSAKRLPVQALNSGKWLCT